jgi:hypothetical protein
MYLFKIQPNANLVWQKKLLQKVGVTPQNVLWSPPQDVNTFS